MREYGFSLARTFPYKDRIYERIWVSEKPYSRISYTVKIAVELFFIETNF